MKKNLLFMFWLLFSNHTFAGVELIEAVDYDVVVAAVHNALVQSSPNSTLVVFDIDDTLIAYNECDAVATIENGFKRFMASVRQCDAVMTSPKTLELISTLQSQSVPVMAMTARPYKFGMLSHTLRQLQDLRLYDGDEEKHQLNFNTAPAFSSEFITIPFQQPLKNGELREKEVGYQNGVSFVSSANKGLALKAFNRHNRKRYRDIVFVDDNINNIEDLNEVYKTSRRNITLIHYTEYVESEEGH